MFKCQYAKFGTGMDNGMWGSCFCSFRKTAIIYFAFHPYENALGPYKIPGLLYFQEAWILSSFIQIQIGSIYTSCKQETEFNEDKSLVEL